MDYAASSVVDKQHMISKLPHAPRDMISADQDFYMSNMSCHRGKRLFLPKVASQLRPFTQHERNSFHESPNSTTLRPPTNIHILKPILLNISGKLKRCGMKRIGWKRIKPDSYETFSSI
uniref:Uncharacterized protein n=1 Tax=Percolomonas cosmopolitus TaxID=63605 RepID=A0A7S1KR56_9EUKA|mmetsp:Transcript_5944/g.22568  ORF Transcript_5944/g.22568 Transcript_5944/m.22568 type:complete len:119 (+) Transcript_5944:130-486(+)